jgi:hypothetical protein
MKDIAGNVIVPLYDDRHVNHEDGFNEIHIKVYKRVLEERLIKKQLLMILQLLFILSFY